MQPFALVNIVTSLLDILRVEMITLHVYFPIRVFHSPARESDTQGMT